MREIGKSYFYSHYSILYPLKNLPMIVAKLIVKSTDENCLQMTSLEVKSIEIVKLAVTIIDGAQFLMGAFLFSYF